jgi:hypothetical protein
MTPDSTCNGWNYGDALKEEAPFVAPAAPAIEASLQQTAVSFGEIAREFSPQDVQGLLQQLDSQPQAVQDHVLQYVNRNSLQDPQAIAGLIDQTLSATDRLRAAIENGEDPIAPGMEAIKQALVEEQRNRAGAQPAQQSQPQLQNDAAAVTGGVIGMTAATLETASADPIEQLVKTEAAARQQLQEEEQRRNQQPGYRGPAQAETSSPATASFAAVAGTEELTAEKLAYVDMGPTGAAIAAQTNGFTPNTGIPGPSRERGGQSLMA